MTCLNHFHSPFLFLFFSSFIFKKLSMAKTTSIANGVLENLLYDNLIGLSASIREAITPKRIPLSFSALSNVKAFLLDTGIFI